MGVTGTPPVAQMWTPQTYNWNKRWDREPLTDTRSCTRFSETLLSACFSWSDEFAANVVTRWGRGLMEGAWPGWQLWKTLLVADELLRADVCRRLRKRRNDDAGAFTATRERRQLSGESLNAESGRKRGVGSSPGRVCADRTTEHEGTGRGVGAGHGRGGIQEHQVFSGRFNNKKPSKREESSGCRVQPAQTRVPPVFSYHLGNSFPGPWPRQPSPSTRPLPLRASSRPPCCPLTG